MKNATKLMLALAACLTLALPASAAAHVTVSPEEAPAEGYAMLTFTVPHGCETAATNRVQIQMPPEVISATPGVVPGWKIRTEEGKLPEPGEMHGEKVTEGVRVVTWTGGPLAHDHLEQFPLSVAFAGDRGEDAEFKVLQGCVNGEETPWIQSTPDNGEEPAQPAPSVELVSAESGHDTATDREATETASEKSSDEGGSADTIAIIALIVGALGLISGSAALVSSRRK